MSTEDGAGAAIAELRTGQRFEGRYACVRKDRLTARNGAPTWRSSCGTAPASFRPGSSARPIGSACASNGATRSLVRGKLERFKGQLAAELDDVRRLEPGSFDPAEFLPAAYRSVEELEGFLEHLTREVHDPGLRGVVERLLFASRSAGDFRRAPCTRGRPPRLPGWTGRAHGLRGDAGRGAVPAPPTARLRPVDGGGARPRRRQDARVHLLRRSSGSARRAGCSAIWRSEPRWSPVWRAGSPPTAGWRCFTACSPTTGPRPARSRAQGAGSPARGFASAEALALYRLNALDASVKGVRARALGSVGGRIGDLVAHTDT